MRQKERENTREEEEHWKDRARRTEEESADGGMKTEIKKRKK